MFIFPPHVIYLPLVFRYEPQPVNVETQLHSQRVLGENASLFALTAAGSGTGRVGHASRVFKHEGLGQQGEFTSYKACVRTKVLQEFCFIWSQGGLIQGETWSFGRIQATLLANIVTAFLTTIPTLAVTQRKGRTGLCSQSER